MNENSAIVNVNAAANRFCSRYRDLGSSLDKLGNEISQLQTLIEDKTRRYNIAGKINDFYNDDSITIESYYNSLNDNEKFKDENGNIVPIDLLNDAERQALESQVKQMNAEQSDVKLDVVVMNAKIDKMEMDFEKTIIRFKNQLRLDYENFNNEKQHLSVLDRKLDNEIADCEYEIARIGASTTIANSNKTALIKDFRKQIAMANVNKLILNSTSKAADVYHIVFESAYNSVDVNMYDDVDFIKKEDQIKEELSIADKLQNLIDGFRVVKDNYSIELDKISAIELSIDEFNKKYENIGNANAFVQAALEATQSLRATIDKIEEAKDIDKAKTDENGNVITPEPDNVQGNNGPDNNTPGNDGPDSDNNLGNNGPDNNTQGNNNPDNNLGNDGPDNNSQGNDGPDNDNNLGNNGTDNNLGDDGPDNNSQGNDGPDNDSNLGNNGVSNDVADLMKRAKRVKSARRWDAVKRTMVLGGVAAATLIAACGLGFIPPVASLSATLITATNMLSGAAIGNILVSEAINDLPAFAKYKATSFKLNRIARKVTKQFNKHNKKSGIKFKVRTNPETGEIRFGIVNDGQDVGLLDSRSTGMILGDDQSLNQAEVQSVVQMFQEQLDKAFPAFNGEKRGDYQKKFNLPPITVDNLPVLYTQFGGYNFNLEGEQFGMMDEVKYRKAHKEGKGIKNLFKKIKNKFKRDDDLDDLDNDQDDDLDNGLPGINPTQNSALDDAVNRPGVVGDGTSTGQGVDDDDLDDLLAQVRSDNNPDNSGNASGDDLNSQQQDPVQPQQNPVQPQQNGDGLNASNLAGVFEKIRNGFGLDDIESESLLNDLNGLSEEQIAQLDANLENISDRDQLISVIEQLKAPAADMGRTL